jgi:hypothetical protein
MQGTSGQVSFNGRANTMNAQTYISTSAKESEMNDLFSKAGTV